MSRNILFEEKADVIRPTCPSNKTKSPSKDLKLRERAKNVTVATPDTEAAERVKTEAHLSLIQAPLQQRGTKERAFFFCLRTLIRPF